MSAASSQDGVRNVNARLQARLGGATVRECAVVDVGSNSVRLVHYRIVGRAIVPVYNDRVSAGLGEELANTGRLSSLGVERAMRAFQRFRMILEARRVVDVTPVATAAVREARDRDEFADVVANSLGHRLQILSGPEEGRLSALGVVCGDPDADGLVGDLGGSSLELARVADGEAELGATLLLGPLAVRAQVGDDLVAARRLISRALKDADVPQAGERLYAVGGAWRNVARVDMHRRGHPLRVLHHYEMSRTDIAKTAQFILETKPSALVAETGVSRRRAETLALTACVLEELLKRTPDVANVIVSAQGLREGLLYSKMSQSEREGDPLIAGLDALARASGGDQYFASALERWLEPSRLELGQAFTPDRDRILIAAACRMADFARRLHPDYRADSAARAVMIAPVVGVSHAERAFLSRALHHRYAGNAEPSKSDAISKLETAHARVVALSLGLAMRLAAEFSARTESLLKESELVISAERVCLRVERRSLPLISESVEKRLDQLAAALGREALIVRN